MKKDFLFKQLEDLILPENLKKEYNLLKRSAVLLKRQQCNNIHNDILNVVGVPAIDKEYDESEIAREFPFLFKPVNNEMIMFALKLMGELNCFIKTKTLTNKQKDIFYALKKDLVATLIKHTNIMKYEFMHYKFENDNEVPVFYAVFGYDGKEKHYLIHQPLTNVEKFFTEEELSKEKENAEIYQDDHKDDVFEYTEEEKLQHIKKLSSLYFYTKAIKRSFKSE
jgi:hypothetical protein